MSSTTPSQTTMPHNGWWDRAWKWSCQRFLSFLQAVWSTTSKASKPTLYCMLWCGYYLLLGKKILRNYLNEIDCIMQGYRRFRRHPDIENIARFAEQILSLNHQYGEGWLIAGEVGSLVKSGISNVFTAVWLHRQSHHCQRHGKKDEGHVSTVEPALSWCRCRSEWSKFLQYECTFL